MATGILNVSPEKISSTSEAFRTSGGKIRNLTEKMTAEVKALSGKWTGEAGTSYIQKFEGLSDDMSRLYKLIDEHVKDLDAIAKNYRDAESANLELANSLPTDILN